MTDKTFPNSKLPIRKTVDFLPQIFQTEANEKFLGSTLDPMVQPGLLEKLTGYIGRRYGKTYRASDVYLDNDGTLRSRYQLEPAVVTKDENQVIQDFYDYLDVKNQLKFFSNDLERDDKITKQTHFTWDPPISWDKFVNYREYYWEPLGPPSIDISGQYVDIISTYRVSLGFGSTYIFTPDAVTNNPTIRLYRGQTYRFKINAPQDGFVIRTNYETLSLTYNLNKSYSRGDIVRFGDQLWQATSQILPGGPAIINEFSSNWTKITSQSIVNTYDYNHGVTNNGIENGELVFEVPYDAPDLLYYQSKIDPDRLGQFIISDVEANTKIDVEKEILGKSTYKSSNGIDLSNGMHLKFRGQVIPEKFSDDVWVVEGVGSEITLTRFTDLVVNELNNDSPDVLFDVAGFDNEPFDDATAYPGQKDYLTIARNSKDSNPWSRYNRWYHRSVLELAHSLKGTTFESSESQRAKRPIIEFLPNLQLYNHGSFAKETVDYIDNFTEDAFSTIEGSLGYNVDGEFLFEGARILFVADRDVLVNNRIFVVRFINHLNKRQIHLEPAYDSEPNIGDGVLIRRGRNQGGMYHFVSDGNGNKWVQSQSKTSVNQYPLFDAFDIVGISFGDKLKYPDGAFSGTKIISYRPNSSTIIDNELNFSLSYLNIENVGDILFDWNWDADFFEYLQDQKQVSVKVSSGFYRFNDNRSFRNGWVISDDSFFQPIIDSYVLEEPTDTVTIRIVDWLEVDVSKIAKINFYLDGNLLTPSSEFFPYTRTDNTFKFSKTFTANSVLTIKIVGDVEPNRGYYQIPAGLEKNPLNEDLSSFTLGEATDHLRSALEFDDRLIYSSNSIIGIENLRDLDGYQSRSNRFLKHSGSTPLSIFLLCDKNYNIIKSVDYCKRKYSGFKNDFLKKATEISYNGNPVEAVDEILTEMNRIKNLSSPFADSDMIGNGSFTSIDYVVVDPGVKTFSLSTEFNLNEPSDKAVYVYYNDQQLLNERDYVFNDVFGFVTILISLDEGSSIQIREYSSTSFNYIPPTPTKLGLYPKYTPRIFVDDTYLTPKTVIQGHDGSLLTGFNDFRDDILLELETRIYNNLKQSYDEKLFDINTVIGNYYYDGEYTKQQFDKIVVKDFLSYLSNSNIGYTLNEYFDSENSFTYTYTNMTDASLDVNLPGWWRGVYKWFYDTDRPHQCPWEMLGFSEKPDWWETEYGPEPYTKGNLILWSDLKDGIIRQGPRAGRYERYKRSSLLDHIPVDNEGKLLSPLDSNLAQNFSLINNQGPFVFGDHSPVEDSWRKSSEFPFSIISAMCLLKPFEYINVHFDKNKNIKNNLGQLVDKDTNRFIRLEDFNSFTDETITSGLINFVNDYIKSTGRTRDNLIEKLLELDVLLSSRLSGFVDKQQQKYILDTKNSLSRSSGIFVPPEDYDIVFDTSVPIETVSYSAVMIEKTDRGWVLQGYDSLNPFFYYYEAVINQKDPLITVGGVSAPFSKWAENTVYNNGQIVEYRDGFYSALTSHTSEEDFDKSKWKKIPNLPITGAAEAFQRRTFNELNLKSIPYGQEFYTIQSIVDFLLGYEQYLVSIGFVFDDYDAELKSPKTWLTSAKEFMFWTRHNWNIGSLIALSPAATKITIENPVGVPESLLDSFYDYRVLKSDGKSLLPRFIDVKRDFQKVEISTTDTLDGIYFIAINYVLKEHVVVFNDRTVFNDVIYDKRTGYRQERIKTQGFRTVDWDGDYTSPGFLFDNVNIETWQPFRDYRLGDIVSYRAFYWVSQVNQQSTDVFDDTKWSKLDSLPEKRLIPNFDFRINLFEDYYEVTADGIGQVQRDLARHSVGYQPRSYLQNLSEDAVTQFQLYQGFIREKGTINSLTKVFNKTSLATQENIILDEEWAFRVGKFGGIDQKRQVEISLLKEKFLLNPQLIEYVDIIPAVQEDRYYRIDNDSFTIKPNDINDRFIPVSYNSIPTITGGYVRVDQVDHILSTRADLLNYDIELISENQSIWIVFEFKTWNVYRFNRSRVLTVQAILRENTDLFIFFNRRHNIKIGDVVGLKIENLTGFYEVQDTGRDSIRLVIPEETGEVAVDLSTVTPVWLLTKSRFKTYNDISEEEAALLPDRSKIWVDRDENNLWEVIEKKKQFKAKNISSYGTSTPSKAGDKVIYDDINKLSIVGIPGSGLVITYIETPNSLSLRQIINPPDGLESFALGSFGTEISLSPDSKWMAVSAPLAFAPSNFRGDFSILIQDPNATFLADDIVLYNGRLWRALEDIGPDDGSTTIDVYNQSWTLANVITATSTGTNPGFYGQGFVTLYEFANQQWNIRTTLLSPRPAQDEFFGFVTRIAKIDSGYLMTVSAPNSLEATGRVYVFENVNNQGWVIAENTNYMGVYQSDSSMFYPKGSIAYSSGSLYESKVDQFGDGSTISLESNDWVKVENVSTSSALPKSLALEDDGSTLLTGITDENQIFELVKSGDKFGASLALSNDGSILVVGAPYSDNQFFENYKGLWRPDYEYVENDVVKYEGLYHRLTQRIGESPDSTTRSQNEEPVSLPWQQVGDSTDISHGKVFVYRRINGIYQLRQTITADTLSLYSDLESGLSINIGDEFGHALDIDSSGNNLVITSPRADVNFQNQGSVYIFNRDRSVELEYRLVQKLESFENYPNEYFGQDVCLSPSSHKVVVGAKNSPYASPVGFDFNSTVFDGGATTFFNGAGYSGAVYVFEKKAGRYFLVEKLESELSPFESFGDSVYCTEQIILVGSPEYIEPAPHGPAGFVQYEGPRVGIARLFKKAANVNSWEIIAIQEQTTEISLIPNISLFDTDTSRKILDLDIHDPAKFKILGVADQELSFKTDYDPAIYNVGTDSVVVDLELAWAEKHVGELWWNLSAAKWLYYEQGELSYRLANWGRLAEGSSIQVCEWVETPLLPSEWAALADTTEGLALGISGQPLYPNNDVYVIKNIINPVTGLSTETQYYYWIVNKRIIPNNSKRNLSAGEVASIIIDPAAVGLVYAAPISHRAFLLYNADRFISSDSVLVNFLFNEELNVRLNNVHNEYEFLCEGRANSIPTEKLERKWIDSLIGFDAVGNRVPDNTLSEKEKYGLSFRPRQSMFVNRQPALKSTILYINEILKKQSFVDLTDLSDFNSKDEIPSAILNEYDVAVDTLIDRDNVGIARIKKAIISVNIVDGEISTADILEKGYGYKVPPTIEIVGNGQGAEIRCTLDTQGAVQEVIIVSRGRLYTQAAAVVRAFSVLVRSDSTQNNLWSIYSYDDERKNFFRIKTQSFDVTRFWSYIDWWKSGYSAKDKLVKEVAFFAENLVLDLRINDLVRIKEYGSGGWAVLRKIDNVDQNGKDPFELIGRQNGTIELKSDIYDADISGVGFDRTRTFDTDLYDLENNLELRIILNAVKNNIFIGEYQVEWNNLFFKSVRYAFEEQQFIDWAFKTSLISVIHDVGNLTQKLNYKNDNLDAYIDYVHEIKPYRTTIRKFTSRYNSLDTSNIAVTDFDLPSAYSSVEGKIIPINQNNSLIDEYPWKWWKDNNGYEVVSIVVTDTGFDYTAIPQVLIEGNGTGAKARAYISAKKVVAIEVTDPGKNYTSAPRVSIIGGNGSSSRVAKASATIGNSLTRSVKLGLKFDRITKVREIESYIKEERFVATGRTAVFDLLFPPSRDRSKVQVFINRRSAGDELILQNRYRIEYYVSTVNGYETTKGRLILNDVPKGRSGEIPADVITIVYEINDSLLGSIERIEKYYTPGKGMKSRDINQLMTGIDFGGVKIQGSTFDVTGGWDALPWFSDTWDSVEINSDYYVVVDGSTIDITLPFVPVDGQIINIYIKRLGDDRIIRVDDPYFNPQLDSASQTNPNAEIPTFIGDGSTNIIPIGAYISTNAGDTLIFRPIESDGSISITYPNIVDTIVTGGSLINTAGAYSTATGLTPDEIVIEGGKFIDPSQVYAPEENIPGQILDAMSLKVFTTIASGSTVLQNRILLSDGIERTYNIGIKIFDNQSVLVYVDKIKKLVDVDFELDFINNTITFNHNLQVNSIIEIIAFGIGGISLLDYQEFVADGDTNLFLTDANFNQTTSVVVTINGIEYDASYVNSSSITDTLNRTLVQFGEKPQSGSVIKIICLGQGLDTDSSQLSIIKVNQKEIFYDGSSRKFDLDGFAVLSRGSSLSSVVVEIDGIVLKGVDTVYDVYDGNKNTFNLGVDPEKGAGSILPSNVRVYINNQLRVFIRDYDFDGVNNILTVFPSVLNTGDNVKIEVDVDTQYYFENNDLVLVDDVYNLLLNNDDSSIKNKITITWFSEYPSMQIISDEYVGGKVNYQLKAVPLDASYVWVYKNGIRLTQDVDYKVSLPRAVIYFVNETVIEDNIKVIQFGSQIYNPPVAYELYKDVLNVNRFKRYSIGELVLMKDLNYFDQEIVVNDGTLLFDPILERNIPGMITIKDEKITYFRKIGNVLSQLRRGYLGSSVLDFVPSGTNVINSSPDQTIPYNEDQLRFDFVSDGSSILIGPLDLIPSKYNKTSWYRSTIPNDYGPCYELEVFVAGRRLRKDPVNVYDQTLGMTSPQADKLVEAEFSVNGTSAFIRLTSPAEAGKRITILKRVGKVWYDKGESTISAGRTLARNANSIAKFISNKNTKLPE
jgi:hypothetical protein